MMETDQHPHPPESPSLLKLFGSFLRLGVAAFGGPAMVAYIRDIRRYLERIYAKGRWRKMKGIATVRLTDGTICEAEIHWFESHSVGRKDFKVKRVIR